MSTPIQITGNLTADPELRYTKTSATAVANLGVAVNHRRRDERGDWVDDGTTFHSVTVWGKLAENVAESLVSGTRVVVIGSIRSRSFTSRDGETRTRLEVDADEVLPSLRYATATIAKNRSGAQDAEPAA